MGWSERQIAMLREIGVRVWAPPEEDAPALPVAIEEAAAPAMSQADASPVGTLDWPALRDAVAACTACKLCETRRQTVFGVGNTRAHWMIVGEAPGEQEDRQGEPFVGKSGQLLDNMLRAVSLTRGVADPAFRVAVCSARRRAHAQHRDAVTLPRCRGRFTTRRGVRVIGEQEHIAVVEARLLQQPRRPRDGTIGTTAIDRHDVGRERIQEQRDVGDVVRQRRDGEGIVGKDHQPDLPTRARLQQPGDLGARLQQA